MKHLKLFNDVASYEAFKDSSDFVLPNVSYITNQRQTLYCALKKEKPIVLKAKFDAGDANGSGFYPNSVLCYSNGVNVKKLIVDDNIIFEYDLKDTSKHFVLDSNNLAIDWDEWTATCPDEYLINGKIKSWTIKPKDSSIVLTQEDFKSGDISFGWVYKYDDTKYFSGEYICTEDIFNEDGSLEIPKLWDFDVASNSLSLCETAISEDWWSYYNCNFVLFKYNYDTEQYEMIDTVNDVSFSEIVGMTGDYVTEYEFETPGEHNVEFTLSDTVIKPGMFAESCIKEIDLGDQITYIGDEAFRGCQAQKTDRMYGCRHIKCSSKIAPALGKNVFTYINKYDTYAHCIVEVPEGADYSSWYEDAHSIQSVSFKIHDKGGILWIGQKQELAESIFNYFDEICKRYNVSEDVINSGGLTLYTSIVSSDYNHDQIPGTLGTYNSGNVDGEWKSWVDVIANVADDDMYKNVLDKIYYWDDCWGYYGKYHIISYYGPNEPMRGTNRFLTRDGYLYTDAD